MTKLRVSFEIQGNIRFLSHLDLLKVTERALRRGEIPVEFSQGFNPHPQIAFGPARPVGLASAGEYFDVDIRGQFMPEEFVKRINGMLPAGYILKAAREIKPGTPALMAVLNCASYRVLIKTEKNYAQEELEGLVTDLFAQKELIMTRHSPKGTKQFDIRPGIWTLTAQQTPQGVLLEMDLLIGNSGNVKPNEVVTALNPEWVDQADYTRTGLYIRKENGEKTTPM